MEQSKMPDKLKYGKRLKTIYDNVFAQYSQDIENTKLNEISFDMFQLTNIMRLSVSKFVFL